MRVKIIVIVGIIGVYNFLYAPEEVIKNREGAQIQWIEGTRGWSENGIYLWTGVSPLPSYNVGIGTNAPSYKLDVLGHGRFQGDLYINSWPIRVTSQPPEGYVLKWVGAQGAFIPQPDSGGIGGSGTATQVAFWTSATTIGGNNNLWWDNTNARLGIGTNAPQYKLDVVGASRIQGDLYINSWPIKVTSAPTTGYVLKWDGSAFTPQQDATGIGGSGTPTQVAFWTSATTIGGSNNLWWDNTNSRLGIGTNAPSYRLDVVGASRIQGDLYINSWPIRVTSAPTTGYVLKWDGSAFTPQPETGLPPGTAGQTLRHDGTSWVANSLLFNNGTNIGIGTTSPAYKLDVLGNSRIQGDLYINSWPIRVTSQPTDGYVLKWVQSQGAFIPQPDAEHNVYTVQLTQLFVTGAWNSYVDIPGMSITFTPRHNVVYIYVSVMARNADANGYYAQHGQSGFALKVVNVNTGAMVAKTGSSVTDYDDINGTVTSGSASINGVPVSVTPGQQVTFKLQLMPWALWSNGYIAINPVGVGDQAGDHCVFTIID